MNIEYSSEDYNVIQTEEMDSELLLKFVQFSSGYYGIITENPKQKMEEVILVSPEKGETNLQEKFITGGLGCMSYMVFARDAKRYMENAPIELVVQMGHEAPDEYREVITRDQAKTLHEKVEICHEIMQMKLENSLHYKYGDYILTAFMCVTVIMFLIAIVNSLHLYGVI